MKKYRILIAEDHIIVRNGLKSLLSSEPDLEIIAECDNGLSAVRSVEKFKPDLVIMDLSLPRMNGAEAIQEIKKINCDTKILVLTMHKSDEYVFAALKAGANGYLLKEAKQSELFIAIRQTLEGKYYLSPMISQVVVNNFLGKRQRSVSGSAWDSLSQREREILKLIAEGFKNREIADYLCISIKTVEKHRASLMRKLNLHSAVELTVYALNKGLITK